MSTATDLKVVASARKPQSALYDHYCWLCSWFPQDASGDPPLFPITAQLCNWCSVVCIILAVWAHVFYEYADTRPTVTDEDPTVVWFHFFTATLALGGLIYEVSLAYAINVMGMSKRYQDDIIFRRRLRLNRKMIFCFFFLTMYYFMMSFDFHVVHKGWLANYHGGHQIVYSVRYAEWVTCAPMVLSINGQMDHTSEGKPRNGMIPSSMLTGIYCLISWQGLVVKDVYCGWILIIWAFVGYFVASAEQLMFAAYIKNKGCAGPLRAGLIVYLVVMIGIYGVVYLLPIPGFISPYLENKFYCLGDASFKLWTSTMLLATNDVAANDELRRCALAKAADLARIIQTASVPIFGVDVNANINEWNHKTELLTGVSRESAIGTPVIRMIGAASQHDFQTMLKNALDGDEQVGSLETSFYLQDSESDGAHDVVSNRSMLMLSAAPTKDRFGKVQGVTFIGCDLTEVTAFKEAEARKVRFMAIVSHELRSPLHGIIGLMDYFLGGEQDEKKLRYINMVRNCATRLLDLVVNIMELASMKSKNPKDPAIKLSHDPVELNKIMEEILVLVKNSYDKSGKKPLLKDTVTIVNNMEQLPIIEADAHKCTQVLYNIMTNACKFTAEGTITVSSRVDVEGEWVEVIVADTGRGIEASCLERIFEPFEQVDSPLVRGHQGIGLGLSIALEVVKRHGGRIQVQSQVGVGTTFIVRLPMVMKDSLPPSNEIPSGVVEEKDVARSPKATETVATATRLQGSTAETTDSDKKPLVLSVEDDPVNQEIVQVILGDDYDIHPCMTGAEAMDYLRFAKVMPDLVLLDVMMPQISGLEVCRFVRQELGIAETTLPILMLSADAMGTTVAEALNCGANSYVFKPFDKYCLTAQVQSALRIKSLHKKNLLEKTSTQPGPFLGASWASSKETDSADQRANSHSDDRGLRRRARHTS